jgi:tetratricopeptide (TPR) repeat protein
MSPLTAKQRLVLAVCLPLVLLFAGLSLWHGLRAAWGDASTLSARWLVAEWREDKGPGFTPALWLQTRNDLLDGLKITPDNPQLYDDLGYLHASRAQAIGPTEADSPLGTYQRQLLDSAITHYRMATQLRPTMPYSWVYLAKAKELRDKLDAEMWQAFDKALRLGSGEAAVRLVLVEIACTHWGDLSPTRQNDIGNLVAITPPHHRSKLLSVAKAANCPLVLPTLPSGSP